MQSADPYTRTDADIRQPPASLGGILHYLGPGLIVTGSIVGSGELIMSTKLGAQIGFSLLWFMIISCVIKVVVQIELARYTVSSGKTTLEAFNDIPGPRVFGTSWLVWWWFLMLCATVLQTGGIVSAVGQTLHLAWPFPASLGLWDTADPAAAARGSVSAWTVVTALSGMLLLYRGRYSLIQNITTLLVFLFTMTTVATVFFVQGNPDLAISGQEFLSGFKFDIPPGGLLIAFGVFGITGVGASELIYYPYWCLEKGYARFVGPRSEGGEWAGRAAGWVRVLRFDAWLAMVVYTLATIAFYLLGAAVLHRDGLDPEDHDLIKTLSQIYHQALPVAGYAIFLIGSFVVLYSTFFVTVASLSRVLTDFARVAFGVQFRDEAHRARWIGRFVIGLPVLYCFIALVLPRPVLLVTIGGVAQALTLPPIAAAAIYLRYKRTDQRLAPNIFTDICLWITAAGMWIVGAYNVWKAIAGPAE